MGGKSSTNDRAKDYKEAVEIKQAKNKMDKLDESTRVFQAHLLKSTLNSEEYLKHIAKHTKVMAKETLSSNIIKLLKYSYVFYRAFKFFKPEAIPNAIKKFEDFIQRNTQGARGMKSQCCCDGHGNGARMRRTQRRHDRRASGTSYSDRDYQRDEAKRRSEARIERSRQTRMDRAERIRQNAHELKQRKITQLQTKNVQDALHKSMRRFGGNAKRSITGMFDVTGAGLKNASSTIAKSAATSSSTLTRVGLASVATVTAWMTGLFSTAASILTKAGRGVLSLGRGGLSLGASGLAFARANPGFMAKGGALASGGYGLYRWGSFDPSKDFGTSKYADNSGLGDQYIGRSTAGLSGALKALTFGTLDLDGWVNSAGNQLNEAYYKKHGKRLGAATNFSQLVQSGDDALGSLFGYNRGLIGTGGNYVGTQIYNSWGKVKELFFGVSESIDEQTEVLSKRLDTNFKDLKMDRQEARKLTEEDKARLAEWAGIPKDQGHSIPHSPLYPRPKSPESYTTYNSPDAPLTSANRTDPVTTHRRLMDRTTIHSGGTLRSSGWSRYDDANFELPTPSGFTGDTPFVNRRLSVRNTTPKMGETIRRSDPNRTYENASKKDLIKGTYDAFRNAGFSHEGALALVGEVGREGSFQPNNVFGTHIDPHNNAVNAGFISWQGDRGKKLLKYLGDRGLLDEQGKITRTQASLDAQAKFLRQEMESGVGRRGNNNPELAKMLSNPNVDPNAAMDQIGKDYIQWRIDDPKYRDSGIRNRTSFYNQGKAVAGNGEVASPTLIAGLMNPDSIGLTSSIQDIPAGGSASQIAVNMQNQGAIRDKDITDDLRTKLQTAVANVYGEGHSVEVYSGGQTGRRRTGSHRHDSGKAADVRIRAPDGTMLKGDDLAKLGQYWLANEFGGVGLEMNQDGSGRGGIHLDQHWNPNKNNYWDYSGRTTPTQLAALKAGREGVMPELVPQGPGMKPIQVEIASISAKSQEDMVSYYSQSSGLGAIFGPNKATAAGNPDGTKSQASMKGDRLGGGLYPNTATGSVIQDRINSAHESATAHVAAEKIRPNVNPEISIAAASEISVPSADEFSQRFSGVTTEPPKNPVPVAENPSLNGIPHYADPELMYPLLYHHLGN